MLLCTYLDPFNKGKSLSFSIRICLISALGRQAHPYTIPLCWIMYLERHAPIPPEVLVLYSCLSLAHAAYVYKGCLRGKGWLLGHTF